jgi:hypothetical protein
MTQTHPITPPPPHLLKKFSAQAQDEAKKRNGAGYLKTFATLCIEWALNSQPTPNDRQIRSSEITPPPALRQLWAQQAQRMNPRDPIAWQEHIANQAAQWGADQELEACCEWLKKNIECHITIGFLRDARRPEPPSLKERLSKAIIDGDEREALKLLEDLDD